MFRLLCLHFRTPFNWSYFEGAHSRVIEVIPGHPWVKTVVAHILRPVQGCPPAQPWEFLKFPALCLDAKALVPKLRVSLFFSSRCKGDQPMPLCPIQSLLHVGWFTPWMPSQPIGLWSGLPSQSTPLCENLNFGYKYSLISTIVCPLLPFI